MAPVPSKLRIPLSRDGLRLAGGSAVVFASRVGGAVLAYLTQILLARWLGAEQLGLYVFAYSWCILLANLAGLGLPNAAFRVVGQGLAEQRLDWIRGFVRRSRQLTVVSGLLVIGLGLVLLTGVGVASAQQRDSLVIALLSVPVFALIRLHGATAQAQSWLLLMTLPGDLLRPLLFLLAVAAAWAYGAQMAAAEVMLLHLAAMLAVMLGQAALLSRRLQRQLVGVPPSVRSDSWLRIALPLLVVTLVGTYFAEINIIIAGTVLPPDQVAIYNACFRTALLIGFGIHAVDAVTLPRVARFHAAGERAAVQRLIAVATQMKFWGAVAAVVLLALVGDLVLALFGPEFVAGRHTLVILALGQVVIAAVGPVGELLGVTGHERRCLPTFIAVVPGTAALNLILVPLLGLEGAALAAVLAILSWSLWLHRLVRRHLGIRPSVLAALRRR